MTKSKSSTEMSAGSEGGGWWGSTRLAISSSLSIKARKPPSYPPPSAKATELFSSLFARVPAASATTSKSRAPFEEDLADRQIPKWPGVFQAQPRRPRFHESSRRSHGRGLALGPGT